MCIRLCLKLGLIFAFVAACSKPGTRSSPPAAVAKPEPEKKNANAKPEGDFSSGVGLSLMQPSSLAVERCPQYEREPSVDVLPTGQFAFDGDLTEWISKPTLLFDTEHDASFDDILWSKIAYDGESKEAIVGAVQLKDFRFSSGSALMLEFGSLSTLENKTLRMEASRAYLLSATGVSERVGDEWRAVDPRVLSLQVLEAKGSVEWRLEKRQLDGVLGKALWWTRVKTVQAESLAVHDYTALSYFRSEDLALQSEYAITLCRSESFAQVPFRFYQITKKSIGNSDAELIFDHVRSAYEGIQGQLNFKALPVQSLATIIASEPVLVDLASIGVTGDQDLEFVHPVAFDTTLASAIDRKDLSAFYLQLLSTFTHSFLKQGRHQSESGYTEAFAVFFQAAVIRHVSGMSDWLAFLGQRSSQFLRLDEGPTPIGLIDRYHAIEGDSESRVGAEDTLNKTFAFVHLLAQYVGTKDLAAAWYRDGQDLKSDLEATVANPESIAPLWAGWMESMPFTPGLDPSIISDQDFDGLPSYLEAALGTSTGSNDTDEDGWSDLAEITMKRDPLSRLSTPKTLVADGIFGDWQELLPTKIHVNSRNVANSKCPKSSYINAYAALMTDEGLLVSMKMQDRTSSGAKLTWEVAFTGLSDAKDKFFRAKSGQYGYDIMRAKDFAVLETMTSPISNGGDAVEWFFPANILWKKSPGQAEVSVRITTVLEGRVRESCDMTPWFRTLYK